MTKLCPLLKKTAIIHNDARSSRMVFNGLNKFSDNDIVISEFQPCYKEECMFFSEISNRCLFATNQRPPIK